MARKRKADAPGPGHNSGDDGLSDADMRELALSHRNKYKKALEKKKTADAEFKNVCKAAKAELGDGAVAIIKDLIALEEPEGEERLREELQRKAAAMRWAGLPLGSQIELALEAPDRTPGIDRAFDEGRMASMDDRPAKPPYDPSAPQYRAWMDGYQEHQRELAARVGRGNGDNTAAPADDIA